MVGDINSYMSKEIKKKLETIREDYLENISRIKPDLENYHEAAFNKFMYQFHKTMSDILKLNKNLTIDELGEYMSNLSSIIYSINKEIQEKENNLLTEKDKKKFLELQKQIKERKDEKKEIDENKRVHHSKR